MVVLMSSPLEIDCPSVKAMLDAGQDFLLLDCRERDEYDAVHIAQATLLPMSEIQERVAQEMVRMSRDAVVIDRIHRTGSDPSGIALGDFAELLRREQPLWIEAVKSAGIKPE